MIVMIFFQKRMSLNIETLGSLGHLFDCFILVGDDVEVLDEFALYLEKMDKTVCICSEIDFACGNNYSKSDSDGPSKRDTISIANTKFKKQL